MPVADGAYSPECVEGKFSEVRSVWGFWEVGFSVTFIVDSSPLAIVMVGWVYLLSSSFSFPSCSLVSPGPTLPCCLY